MFGTKLIDYEKLLVFFSFFLEKRADDTEEQNLPSLDRFLAKNTSEDNASFEQIMDLAKDKEKLKHAWLYEAEAEFKQVWMVSCVNAGVLICFLGLSYVHECQFIAKTCKSI